MQASNIGLSSEPLEEHRFRNNRHEEFYVDFERRNMVYEWIVEIEDPSEYSDIVPEINARHWSVLDHLPKNINIEII